jgi:copper homeostasis protein (lipoprotein)
MYTPATECTLMFMLSLAGGCTSSPKRSASPVPVGRIAAPVTYTGRLPWPCADCPGIHPTLTLFPDSTFRLRQVYRERSTVFHHLGLWSVEEKDKRLVLRSGRGAPQLFQIVGTDSLRLVDTLGQPIGTELNYWLVRSPQVDPVRDTMTLRGTYTYMADAGRFTECGSGLSFPVAQVGANADLERAYLGARAQPGGPVLVSFHGHFEERRPLEGARLEHVVVNRFDRVWPGGIVSDGCQTRHWRTLTGSW